MTLKPHTTTKPKRSLINTSLVMISDLQDNCLVKF